MKHKIFLLGFAVLVLISCAQTSPDHKVSVDQLITKIESDTSSVVLIDVRGPEELTGPLGHIDGVINIPLPEIEDREDEISEYKDKEIIFICRSGRRSGIATNKFREKGYNAYNLEGGMIEYRKETGQK